MNIVFFGSSRFAAPSLKALLTTQHNISCVVTQPDRQKGRGLHLQGTQIKVLAKESSLEVYQPQSINESQASKFLKGLNPDLFIVISYGQVLSQEVLDIPRIFSINVHASLLPKYRGAAPINWAIINRERNTGITVIKMTKKMDAGPIILQKMTDIHDDDTSITLEDKLSHFAVQLLIDSLESIESGNYKLLPQDEKQVSFAPKLKKADGLIDWNKPAQDIYSLIRGCVSWPGAFTYYNGKILKIYKAKVCLSVSPSVSQSIGQMIKVSPEGLIVVTGEGNLIIEELQIEGKRRMRIAEFISGHKICTGEILGKKIIA